MLSLYQTLSVECRLCTRLGLCTDLKPGRFFFFFFFLPWVGNGLSIFAPRPGPGSSGATNFPRNHF